jgi:hypothetical protein
MGNLTRMRDPNREYVAFHTGKNGQLYGLRAVHNPRRTSFKHVVERMDSQGHVVAGSHEIYQNLQRAATLGAIVDDSHMPLGLPIFFSGIEVRDRKQGIARFLANRLIAEFEKRGKVNPAIHILGFTERGLKCMAPIYRQEGYIPLELREEPETPSWAINQSGWMFKAYGVDL